MEAMTSGSRRPPSCAAGALVPICAFCVRCDQSFCCYEAAGGAAYPLRLLLTQAILLLFGRRRRFANIRGFALTMAELVAWHFIARTNPVLSALLAAGSPAWPHAILAKRLLHTNHFRTLGDCASWRRGNGAPMQLGRNGLLRVCLGQHENQHNHS
jgi:hypothetical protein